MSLIIYFLRHGETTASQTGGYCGTLDPDLTSEGYQMAEDFADAYKSLPWVAVFSSPLRRAVATAKPLCGAAGIRIQLKDGLREIVRQFIFHGIVRSLETMDKASGSKRGWVK